MSALPARIHEAINARQPTRTTMFEDIEVKYDGKTVHFSVAVEHRLTPEGYRFVDRVLYQGKPVILPPGIVAMFEELLEEDDEREDV